MAFLLSRQLPLFIYPSALKRVLSTYTGVILHIRTCYGHTRVAAGDGRPVFQACHTLIDANMAGLEGGDGEGALAELHTGQGVQVQGEASEAPGNLRRRRTH